MLTNERQMETNFRYLLLTEHATNQDVSRELIENAPRKTKYAP
jgi:hypothetical protein